MNIFTDLYPLNPNSPEAVMEFLQENMTACAERIGVPGANVQIEMVDLASSHIVLVWARASSTGSSGRVWSTHIEFNLSSIYRSLQRHAASPHIQHAIAWGALAFGSRWLCIFTDERLQEKLLPASLRYELRVPYIGEIIFGDIVSNAEYEKRSPEEIDASIIASCIARHVGTTCMNPDEKMWRIEFEYMMCLIGTTGSDNWRDALT